MRLPRRARSSDAASESVPDGVSGGETKAETLGLSSGESRKLGEFGVGTREASDNSSSREGT